MSLMTWCPGPSISPHHRCSTHHDWRCCCPYSLPWMPHVLALARHCTAAASHAHTLLMSSSLALGIVFCLRTRCSCPPSPASASEPAVSFGGDDDRPGRSCRRMASTRQPLPFMSSTCTLYRLSHIVRSLYEEEDVRRTAHGFGPLASCCCYERLRRRFIVG